MEAAATPFPREETTPPVTKIYFGPVCKALETLRWSRRTTDYGMKALGCQITIFEQLESFFRMVICAAGTGARRIPFLQ